MTRCAACGAEFAAGALFCGECGRSASSTAPPRHVARRPAAERPPADAQSPGSGDRTTAPAPAAAPAPAPAPTGAPAPVPVAPPSASRPVAAPILPVPTLPDPRAEPGAEPGEQTVPARRSAEARAPHAGPASVVLQFSTGESVRVNGTGLIGRNPVAEPGESVDELVALLDGGRSVSKTHLEFGQERGRLWVSDRFSTNGSVIRPPAEPERLCEPGRRYLVPPGTRVDIGEQYFVVS